MVVEQLPLGMAQVNVYLYSEIESGKTVIIDPGAEAKIIQSRIESRGLLPVSILLTHSHYDHTMALDEIQQRYAIPLVILDEERDLLEDSGKNLSAMGTGKPLEFKADKLLKDGQMYDPFEGGSQLKVLHTPGHTKGGACFYSAQHQLVFSGDTLFQLSIGRTDFYSGDFDSIIKSIREKLFVLPDETIVYPGHGPKTQIGYEKQNNPFLD